MSTTTNNPPVNSNPFKPELNADNVVTNIPYNDFKTVDDFTAFLKPWAPNLAVRTNDYDIDNAFKAKAQISYNNTDKSYHMSSLGTHGLVLKSATHPKFEEAKIADQKMGYKHYAIGEGTNARYYAAPPGMIYSNTAPEGRTDYEELIGHNDTKFYSYKDLNYNPWLLEEDQPKPILEEPKPELTKDGRIPGETTSEENDPTNVLKQINTVAAGANVIRNIGSLIKERFRKNPSDIAPPVIQSPKFQDAVSPVVERTERAIEKQTNTALNQIREQGGSPASTAAVSANATQSNIELSRNAMEQGIQQQNMQATADAQAQNAQSQAVFQTQQYNQQRSDVLAEKSEIAKAQAFESIINSVTGLTNASMSIDEYNRSQLMNNYMMDSDNLDMITYQLVNTKDALMKAKLMAEREEAQARLNALQKQLAKKPKYDWKGITGISR